MSLLEELSAMALPEGEDGEVVEIDVDGKLGPDYEYALVQEALRRSPAKRTVDDCEVLQRATESVKFFRAMNDPAQVLGLCRVMTLRRFGKGEHIFNQGDVGTTFYVIYAGSVKVYVNAGNDGLGTNVATLELGDAFGELALVGDGTRAATCVTAAPTQLLLIEKDAYEATCTQILEEKVSCRFEFLRNIFLFSSLDDEELTSLAKVLTEKKVPKATTIIKQGTSSECMYFVYSGRCRVLMQCGLSAHEKNKLTSTLYETRSSDSATSVEGGSPSAMRASGGAPLLEIGEIGVHQFFGEVALLESKRTGKKKTHSASVVSISKVELFVINKYDFYHNITETTQELMRQYADKFYYDDQSIRQSIVKQAKWDEYKHELMGARVAH